MAKMTQKQIDDLLRSIEAFRTQTGRKDMSSTGPSSIAVRDFLYVYNVVRPVTAVDEDGKLWPFFKTNGLQEINVENSSDGDPWGPFLTADGEILHTAGTTITGNILTCATGYEIKVHRIHTFASRTPDAVHRVYNDHDFGTTPKADTGYYINETTSQQTRWPSAKAQTSLAVWAEDEKYIPMLPGDNLVVLITNNAQAGDKLEYGVIYQQRAVG